MYKRQIAICLGLFAGGGLSIGAICFPGNDPFVVGLLAFMGVFCQWAGQEVQEAFQELNRLQDELEKRS